MPEDGTRRPGNDLFKKQRVCGMHEPVRLALPKGRMKDNIMKLLDDAGIKIQSGERDYRPQISLQNFNVKLLKPQNVVQMLDDGIRDVGFAGADWVANLDAKLIELLDTGMDKVRLVVASPEIDTISKLQDQGKPVRIASEYARITESWIKAQKLDAHLIRAFGATESFPPDDADVILDNTSTGSTLQANGLVITHTVMVSSTRLFCNPAAYADPMKKKSIDEFVLLLRSVLEGRKHVIIEFNVPKDKLAQVMDKLPAMNSPTVSELYSHEGFGVKTCILKELVAELLPKLEKSGATDILVMKTAQIVNKGVASK